jgi:hypothetical protein
VVHAKFGADWTNRFRDIQLLVKFVISSAAILNFEKCHFGASPCMRDAKIKLQLKICENRTDGSKVIQIFVIFKIAAPPSWIPLFLNFWSILLFSASGSMLDRNLMHFASTV